MKAATRPTFPSTASAQKRGPLHPCTQSRPIPPAKGRRLGSHDGPRCGHASQERWERYEVSNCPAPASEQNTTASTGRGPTGWVLDPVRTDGIQRAFEPWGTAHQKDSFKHPAHGKSVTLRLLRKRRLIWFSPAFDTKKESRFTPLPSGASPSTRSALKFILNPGCWIGQTIASGFNPRLETDKLSGD